MLAIAANPHRIKAAHRRRRRVASSVRFPGQYFDQETGLVHNGFRDYDPLSGRYIQSDPLGLYGGGPNTYGYVGSSPLRYFDRLGLFKGPLPCLTTEDCFCIQNPAECPKPTPTPPPIFPDPNNGTKDKDCKNNCKNTRYFSDFQECKDLPSWYKYLSKEQAAKSQGAGARAVRRQDADDDKGICLQPGGHWRIEIEGTYIGYSVIECRCCQDGPAGPEIESLYAVPGGAW